MSRITTALAIYGAVVSTLVILWQVFTWLDRLSGRIKVEIHPEWFTSEPVGGTCGPFLILTAMNDGQKPVKITKAYVTFKGKKGALIIETSELPKLLVEGEEVAVLSKWYSFEQGMRKYEVEMPCRCTAVFTSNAGREHKKKFCLQGDDG
ncbi:MAG: hypothetical protein SVV80_04740 [Planctomycetota bacterium]|nr:hypothetical protein [Planctomycetota bacterium]